LPVRMINAYIDRYQAAARHDIVLTERFFRAAGLLEPPTLLLRPSTMRRVLAGNLRHRTQALGRVLDAEHIPDQQAGVIEQERLAAERHAAPHEAFTRLPPCCHRLIAVLIEHPPVLYAQISARLGLPVGSIGPSRSRCLEKLRGDPAIAALIDGEAASAASELSAQATVP